MALDKLLDLTKKSYLKKIGKENPLEIPMAEEVEPCTGLVVDNPLFEFVLDRRFLPYGRCYLIYGKKSCSKTSFFFDLAKLVQSHNGDVIWIETEKAADLDYAKRQGVNLKRLAIPKTDTLQEALSTAEEIIKNIAKAYSESDTPVLICLDSIAGALPEYETGADIVVGETKVGEHARLMSGFYRRIIHTLEPEKAFFVALNQLKVAIGKPSFGGEDAEALIGGEAQRFHSTYQFKMDRTGDMTKKAAGSTAERKIGSRHKITCKRNKLGREGNTQNVEFDLHIDGGIDWWSPLVRKLGKDYPELVRKAGAYVYWVPENTTYTKQIIKEDESGNVLDIEETTDVIPTENGLRESELGAMIRCSTAAKEAIRKAFGIPDMPSEKEIKQVEETNKKKRKKLNIDSEAENEIQYKPL